MAEGADANCEASHVADDDSETTAAFRGDPLELTLHAQHHRVAGLAIHETIAQIAINDPLPKYVGCQAGFPRLAIASTQ